MSKIAKSNSAVTLQPCPWGHTTADKREFKGFHKFRLVGTSFIRGTLDEITATVLSCKMRILRLKI
jgi:hypothetical protein